MSEPFVSLIIPTHNSEKYIRGCLESILKQNYPKNRYEILIVDDDSSDRTISIAYGFADVKILHNGRKNPEISKAIGLNAARGSFVCFCDSDVYLKTPNWISKMVEPLKNHPDIFASECSWGSRKNFSSLNRYCALLQIADPLARILATRKFSIVSSNGDYEIHQFSKKSLPILHCVLWRTAIIKTVDDIKVSFEESLVPRRLISQGYSKIAYVKNTEAYHYYVNNLSDYAKKRLKIAEKYSKRRKDPEKDWVAEQDKFYLFIVALYMISFIGPFAESTHNAIRDKEVAWLWHPVICSMTIFIYSWFFITTRFRSEK